jgi:hypothetical protein
MDLVLNLLASQDLIPLGITCSADRFLEFVAVLLYPVPLDIIMILKDQFTTLHLIEGCNFSPTLCPIWKNSGSRYPPYNWLSPYLRACSAR